jgi:hypothetical protein
MRQSTDSVESREKPVARVRGRRTVVATSLVSRAEVAAALAKALRSGLLSDRDARKAQRTFTREWPDFVRIPVTEALVARAETLAWNHALRGYDAVQLAPALTWQESVGADIVVATFDTQLWKAARQAGMKVWPGNLADLGQIGAAPGTPQPETQ